MVGTLVNVAGIIVGSLIGVALKKGIPERMNQAILKAEGLGIFLIGLGGVLRIMLRADPETGVISDSGGLLLIVSLVLGCVAGEILRIDERLNAFGVRIETRFGAGGFAKGFVSASLIFAIGAMAVMGALEEGLTGDATTLLTKSMLDFTTAIVLASALGIGVLFAAAPVLVLQGGVTLLAGVISPYIAGALDPFCMVGYVLVLAIGVNFVTGAGIKVANLLPAMAIPLIWHAIPK